MPLGQESNTKYTVESANVEGEILGRDGKSPPSEWNTEMEGVGGVGIAREGTRDQRKVEGERERETEGEKCLLIIQFLSTKGSVDHK